MKNPHQRYSRLERYHERGTEALSTEEEEKLAIIMDGFDGLQRILDL